MRKTKITYILSNIDKAVAFEWIADKLNSEKYELSFILLHNKEPYLYNWLKERNIQCYYIAHFGKKSYPLTFVKTLFTLIKIKPHIVHTHLLDANLIGLFAAKVLCIEKRIYTRHHSTFHYEFFPKAVKWDLYVNSLATDVVAISKNVENVLINKDHVPPEKISLIHHGFDIIKFSETNKQEVDALKLKYKLNDTDFPVIGVISRFIKWKGIEFIIPAFKKILVDYPNAKLILANATGPDKAYVSSILKKELKPNQYIEIPFEPNLFALYHLFNIYVHVPVNIEIEAFGQTYVEALAAGIPSVFTLSGVANEFIINEQNALVVEYKNANQIYDALIRLLTDSDLRMKIIKEGQKGLDLFKVELFISKLEVLYSREKS